MATLLPSKKIWCDEDDHRRFENFVDFNEWFDSESGTEMRIMAAVDRLAQPSKAFFAGDREEYYITLAVYRLERRQEQLCKAFIDGLTSDDHWSARNEQRFDQLCTHIEQREVVPFVGAGMSQLGGFPTWKDHLRQQGRTAGISPDYIEAALRLGQHEEIIAKIEAIRGRDVFIQEIRDAFDRNGNIPAANYLLADLFQDTIITTNYDRLIEQAFDTGQDANVQMIMPADILVSPDANKTTIIKLHGDIRKPAGCIISKTQYDAAYGANDIDMRLPIPQALDYYYRNSSLLFIGCSLNQDRTVRLFEAIKNTTDPADLPQHFAIEQCPANEAEMVTRNEYLLRLGITPIWFEIGHFECVEGIIRLARNELRHRRK